MNLLQVISAGLLLATCARAEVRVFIADSNGVARVEYECTGGEVVRAFALDVMVDRGQILAVSGFFRGPGTSGATGYGIFPASFRDHLLGGTGTNIDWNAGNYTPVANPADNPDTLAGLGSSGVTLEFGGLWDPVAPAAIPPAEGTLCLLQLSQPGIVSVSANITRGGVVNQVPGQSITPVFIGAPVGPIVISVTPQNGMITILFNGGELQSAPTINGPWTDTGDLSGSRSEAFSSTQARFYRVRGT